MWNGIELLERRWNDCTVLDGNYLDEQSWCCCSWCSKLEQKENVFSLLCPRLFSPYYISRFGSLSNDLLLFGFSLSTIFVYLFLFTYALSPLVVCFKFLFSRSITSGSYVAEPNAILFREGSFNVTMIHFRLSNSGPSATGVQLRILYR